MKKRKAESSEQNFTFSRYSYYNYPVVDPVCISTFHRLCDLSAVDMREHRTILLTRAPFSSIRFHFIPFTMRRLSSYARVFYIHSYVKICRIVYYYHLLRDSTIRLTDIETRARSILLRNTL